MHMHDAAANMIYVPHMDTLCNIIMLGGRSKIMWMFSILSVLYLFSLLLVVYKKVYLHLSPSKLYDMEQWMGWL